MKLERDESTYASFFGACCSIVIAIFMLGFVYTKLMILLNRKEINVVEASQDFTFADTEPFSAKEHNFFLAAALTQYDSNRTVTESKEYGEIEFTHYGWGNEDLGYAYGATHIPTHFCSEEELGLTTSDSSVIFPIFKRSLAEVKTYQDKFKCIDQEELFIWGDYNSAMAMQLRVSFLMCQGHDYCKSKEEIREWLMGKYIVLLYNQVRFMAEEFGVGSLAKEARILYIPISSQIRQLIPLQVNVADLYLQDYMSMELNELTLDVKKDLFNIERQIILPYEKHDDVWVSVSLERNLALTEFSRTIYTGFDFLSDVGGFSSILVSFMAMVVSIWNFNSLENTMASKLFKFRRRPNYNDPLASLAPSSRPNFLDIIQ